MSEQANREAERIERIELERYRGRYKTRAEAVRAVMLERKVAPRRRPKKKTTKRNEAAK